jgi:hypothetical protein
MKASLAKGMPHGFEVSTHSPSTAAYSATATPSGERVLFHILNGSATKFAASRSPATLSKSVSTGTPSPVPQKFLFSGLAPVNASPPSSP